MKKIACLWMCLLVFTSAFAQDTNAVGSYFSNWFDRVTRTQAEQPHWITPVFTTTPRLDEELHYDIGRQNTAKGDVTNFGSSKGFELIPAEHVQFNVGLPPYLSHDYANAHDGFGDLSFLVKYRFLAGNEEHGNYVVTAFLGATVPTGSYNNGSTDAVLTPTFGFGKGWGAFDFQSTFGAGIPSGHLDVLGTPFTWNTAFQYRILRKIWPEVEVTSVFFPNGQHSGNQQVFMAPGIVFGRYHLWHRLGLTIGGAEQIAVTRFHTYNHNSVLSVRFPF